MTKQKMLINTTNLVLALLHTDEQTRNSDNYLYLKVLEHFALVKGVDLKGLTVPAFLCSINELGFPCFETVRRTRQKAQQDFPELAGNRAVRQGRAENEQAFRGYAQSDLKQEGGFIICQMI